MAENYFEYELFEDIKIEHGTLSGCEFIDCEFCNCTITESTISGCIFQNAVLKAALSWPSKQNIPR